MDFNPQEIVSPGWWVAHTRPRREKLLAQHALALGIQSRLPLRRSVRKYAGRSVSFECPVFPGYLFLTADSAGAQRLLPTGHVARLLQVAAFQCAELCDQLDAIELALREKAVLQLCPQILPGIYVRIRYGAFRGTLAWVQERRGQTEVVLRVDIIGKGACLEIEADALEPV
ncbi:MAG: hypothetical protein KIT22_00740 [Verrucomicrobiae bacterium]|nr:hypothetical protein [Verrucomicrobiae bacterium]